MNELPHGEISFLFSDIEESTARWERETAIMQVAVATHDALVRQTMEQHGGSVFKTLGDAFCVAFASAVDAVRAAIATQNVLAAYLWDARIAPLAVRIAIHTGGAEVRDNDYFGPTLNRTARLLSVGHGGQILLSQATLELVRDALPAEVTLTDLGTHVLKDLQRPEHIYQITITGLADHFPPLKSVNHHPNNLPVQLTPFIGRQRDIWAICDLLQQPYTRCITITGSGGIGKTRLSLQIAAEELLTFTDGVYFVELDAIRDPVLVPQVIAQALKVRETGTQTLIVAICNALQGKVLLILDNFEQVVDAAPGVFTLLRHCPHLTIMVTSRVLLHMTGEIEYRLLPLELPATDNYAALDVAQCAAIELFIQRAKAVKPDFQVTADTLPLIAKICAKVEGFPLAIELAAARLTILPLPSLLKRLTSRLHLLTSKNTSLSSRHQTLRGAIDWSYHLLEAGEQHLLRCLAVFDGSALEAIGMVFQSERDVVDLVESLVTKSLLQQHEQADGDPRF